MIPGGLGRVPDSHSADLKSAFAATQRLLDSQSPPHTTGSSVGIAIDCTYIHLWVQDYWQIWQQSSSY
jgi:hypothetical protein